MKLVHVSDLHANRRRFNWVLDHAEAYDLIAYTGDFPDNFGAESSATQAQWITARMRALPRPLLWCPGEPRREEYGGTRRKVGFCWPVMGF
jgi:Icc-related predicted phosphoesterase